MSPRTSTTPSEPTAAELSRQRIATALAALAATDDRIDVESTVVTGLEGRLKRGDATVDLDDLAAARSRLADLRTLREAQARELKAAQRAELTDNPQLAHAIAPMVAEAVGVSVEVVTARPVFDAVDALPRAVLVQVAPHQHDPHTGRLSGRVVLHFARTDLHRPADAQKIESALRAGGARFRQVYSEDAYLTGDGATVDRIVLDEGSAWPLGLPDLSAGEVAAHRLRPLATALARQVASSLHVPSLAVRGGVSIGNGESGHLMREVDVKAGDIAVASDRIGSDGTRTITATLDLTARNTRYAAVRYEPNELTAAIRRAVSDLPGAPTSLGRVIGATVLASQPLGIAEGRSFGADCRVEVQFASRVADGG